MANRYNRARRPRGFNQPGVQQLISLAGIKGREKRQLLNQVSGGMVLAAGITGAVFGYTFCGLLGSVIGFGVGSAALGRFVSNGRYYR